MPVTARGGKSKLALCFESAFGQTPETPAGFRLPIKSSQLAAKQTMVETSTITGRRDPVRPTRGNVDVLGQVVVPVDDVASGYWLRAMFGAPETTGSAGAYTHVFKIGDDQPSLVLEQQFPDVALYEMFNGCKVSKFTLALGGDDALTASIDMLGAKSTVGAVPFTATPTDVAGVEFAKFQGQIEEGGVVAANIVSADINIDFGLDGDTYAIGGNGCRADLVEGIVKVTGTVKAFFQNAALLNKAISDANSSLKLQLINGTKSLAFFMPEVVYERTSPGIEGSKGILISLPYRAYFQSGSGGSVLVTTLNSSQTAYE
jgi:hypothetical protein